MDSPRNNRDVSNTVDVTDPTAVEAEVTRIFHELYPKDSVTGILVRSMIWKRYIVANSPAFMAATHPITTFSMFLT